MDNYIIWIVFYLCDPCDSVDEKQYSATDKAQALIDVFEILDEGGYAVITVCNESIKVKTKQQLFEIHLPD